MTYSKFPLLKKRKSENVTLDKFESDFESEKILKPHMPETGLKSILNSYNSSKGRNDLKELIKKVEFARKGGFPILFSLSPDIITNGLSPIFIDLMQRGWVSAVSIDENFLISDFEVSLAGKFIDYKNSFLHNRDIDGISEEAGIFLNIAFKEGDRKEKGAGEAVGEYLTSAKFKFNEYSIIANGYKLNIPIILHSLPGASKLHYHPNFEGKVFGSILDRDFILYSSIVSCLRKNGVYIAMNLNRNSLDILINSLGFSYDSGTQFENMAIGILGEIEDSSVKSDLDIIANSENFSVYHIDGNTDPLLPIIASLLLE